MQSLNVIKIGGKILNQPKVLDSFLDQLVQLNGPKILVHGGGNMASDLCKKLNIPVQMVRGRRVTDESTLEVAVMVYSLLNKKVVAQLQARSCNAIGLSGADLNIIPAHKRTHATIDFGFVGDFNPDAINTHFLRRLLDEEVIPVFPAITHDTNGQLLNTNADTIAASLGVALSKYYKVALTYCFDQPGVLEQVDDASSWVTTLSRSKFAELKQTGAIHDGMLPKLNTAFGALRKNVNTVFIKHAKNLTNNQGTQLIS